MENEKIALKPFHESVVAVLANCGWTELPSYGQLLVLTTIPEGHDEIAEAWLHALAAFGDREIAFDVLGHLAREKKRCEDEAAAKAELVGTLDLGELKQELESLVEALNPAGDGYGMFSWKVMVKEFMARLHRRIGQALGK